MKKNLTTPTKIKAKRLQGFRRRMKTADGRDVIRRRRLKGRKRLTL
ncbi:50S ribosomal protein L34 [bacterium]|nr:MAG: 50S ribosomal protein L34 [bacterium]